MVGYAALFPGQGAQHVGMGKALYDAHDVAKETFKHAARVLGFDVASLCFEGDAAELTRTDKCQPAIFTTSIAAWRVLREVGDWKAPVITAGLSLGEYAALTVAGAWDVEDGLRLVQIRGEAMEAASQQAPGTMAALFGLERPAVERLCRESGAELANLNSPGQIVVSGAVAAITTIEELAKAAGAQRVMRLEVGGAFHSSLMRSAGLAMQRALAQVKIRPLTLPVVANVSAQATQDPAVVRENLVRQLTSPTLWVDSIQAIIAGGTTSFVECAPGKVLAGLLKRIAPTMQVVSLNEPADYENMGSDSLRSAQSASPKRGI